MVSDLVKSHKRNDPDELRAFQSKVLTILVENFGDHTFSADQDPLLVSVDGGDHKLGLSNFLAQYLLDDENDHELRELVVSNVRTILENSDRAVDIEGDPRSMIARVMPQLMPEQFVDKFPAVYFPFVDDVVLAFVIDGEDAYQYVNTEMLNEMGLTPEELRDIAVEHLDERTQGVQMQVFGDDAPLFVVQGLDGFDAVRIILPDLRRTIAEHLGTPFYFGIPNRDFIICWSAATSAEIQANLRGQLAQDVLDKPYPLSGSAWKVNENLDIIKAEAPEADPRATSAFLN